MSNEAGTVGARRPAVTGAVLVIAAGLAVGGCSSGSGSPGALACPSKPGTAVTGTAQAATSLPAAGWTQPGADLANTRDVASAITAADVSKLGVAWTVPLTTSTAHTCWRLRDDAGDRERGGVRPGPGVERDGDQPGHRQGLVDTRLQLAQRRAGRR